PFAGPSDRGLGDLLPVARPGGARSLHVALGAAPARPALPPDRRGERDLRPPRRLHALPPATRPVPDRARRAAPRTRVGMVGGALGDRRRGPERGLTGDVRPGHHRYLPRPPPSRHTPPPPSPPPPPPPP